jgi:membrane associated rhomboid family serine protease
MKIRRKKGAKTKVKKQVVREPIVERGKHIQSESDLLAHIFNWLTQAKGTFFLAVLNIVVFFISLTWSPEFFQSLIFTRDKLLAFNLLPMISSWFLHANWVHLSGNILFLFIFGRIVERRFGLFRFLLIYFSAAILSDLVAGLMFGQGGIGASGAIAGIVAGAILINPFYLTYFFFGVPIPVLFVGWFALFSDIMGLIAPVPGDNVGHIAHLAGFFGVSLIIYLAGKNDKIIRRGFAISVFTAIVFVLLYLLLPNNPFSSLF